MKHRILFTAATVAISAGTAAASEIIYSQPQQSGTAAGISLTQGGNQFSFADRRRADNFTLNTESDIDFVRFWGGTESDLFGPANINNVSSFNIRFYADNAGVPGSIIADYTLPRAATNPTLIPGQNVGFLGASMY